MRQSLLAVVWHRPERKREKERERKNEKMKDNEEEKEWPDSSRSTLMRCGERKRNNGGRWHVSRLSVFTEIPCTLRPITFVTDYSAKVSHCARTSRRTETYPDKLHRTNRQCSQMEPQARRLFKQEASALCGSPRSHPDVYTCRPRVLPASYSHPLLPSAG